MVGNLSKHKKNIDNIYTKAEVDRHIKSAAEEKGDELTKIIDKAAADIKSGLEQHGAYNPGPTSALTLEVPKQRWKLAARFKIGHTPRKFPAS